MKQVKMCLKRSHIILCKECGHVFESFKWSPHTSFYSKASLFANFLLFIFFTHKMWDVSMLELTSKAVKKQRNVF